MADLKRQPVIARQRIGQFRHGDPAFGRARRMRADVEVRVGSSPPATSVTARAASRNTAARAAADRLRCRRCRRTACCARPTRSPRPRPSAFDASARACSSATGLRFCGMMLLHLHEAVGSRRKPNSRVRPQQQILHEAAEADEQHRRGRRRSRAGSRRVAMLPYVLPVGADESEQRARALAVDRETRCP